MHPVGPSQRSSARDFGVPYDNGEHNVRHQTGEVVGDDQPSIAQLFGDLVADAQHLIRKELELAKVELESMGRRVLSTAAAMAAGVSMAGAGGLLLLFMLVHLITDMAALDLWISYAIVGGGCAVVGAILLAVGRARLRKLDLVPRETADALRKDVQW
ncbi:MAG TPA: phage holin family protein, partial [Haliangium sp.]|nr:phage holin family protein [Haliangium sp.]